jgi:molecular chaperone HtpG
MASKSKENLKFTAETSKILQLMIHSLYTNRDIFVRELISNASDACDKLRHQAILEPHLTKNDAEFKINILLDKKTKTLTFSDNGIGMTREELIANLGTIAKSGTQEFLAQLENKKDMPLIGQFGVGFYSSFMVADKVMVVSRHAGSEECWQWESDGQGEFSIAPAEMSLRGTLITLHLKNDVEEYLDAFRLRHIVQTYSDHISFPISITDDEGKTETVNTASALWMRAKTDISPEQYKEFYHHVAHQPDDPWLVLHNKAEGKLEYTSLLFIPSLKPFDLFHPDRKRRVKLYVKRVFITEENVDVIPSWLRFLRGIVDSEDLPLNISRETLQANPMLAKIREALTKRVLSELKKKAGEEEEYKPFWKNFGPVLKEGLCEGHAPREQILEVCKFHSTVGDAMTDIDAYISRMKPGQEEIFYLTGDTMESLRATPQLEGFAKRGIEVLLMNDHVDDFWVNVVFEYKGKKFKSVTRSDIDLDTISEAKDDKKPEEKSDSEAVKKLCARMQEILGDKVKEVRTTGKLTDSAVCLGVQEGAMDFRFERFLIEQKQLPAAAAKILEVNPSHAIIKALARKADSTPELEDAVWLLFDQARLLEGESLSDPASFTRRLQGFVEKSLAA